ncbi:hypothetical protein [Sorangium sp. So ce1151]|uniref:hypothetical protein n=1 Tax=Sorangium sp. So ce1151 TaxID=3133332 RepID=UPI003F5FAFB3
MVFFFFTESRMYTLSAIFSRRPTVDRFSRAFCMARAQGRDLGDMPTRAHRYATECGCMAGGLAGMLVLLSAVPAVILAEQRLLAAALVLPAFLVATGLAKGGTIAVAHWRLARLCRLLEAGGRPAGPARPGRARFVGRTAP